MRLEFSLQILCHVRKGWEAHQSHPLGETVRLILYEMAFKKWILPFRSTFLFET